MESSGDIFAWLFLLVVFVALFGLPAWFVVRHHKKSKPKIKAEKQKYERLSPKEKTKLKNQRHENIAGAVGLVLGIFVGSRLLGNILIGAALGVILGAAFRYAAEKIINE